MEGFSGNAASPARGGDTFTVTGTVANLSGPTAKSVSATLDLPAGWTATPATSTTIGTLAPGASRRVSWTVTIPSDVTAGGYAVSADVSYRQRSQNGTTGGSYQLSVIPKGLMYISDLPFVSETNGFGALERDANLSGGPLSIDGVGYAKGLGTNAVSSVVVAIPAGCTTFSSDVGVDDTAAGKGSVTFSVLADGAQVASTGIMRGGQPAQHLTANVAGISQLTLDAGDAGDGIGHDNADWGDAKLMCARCAACRVGCVYTCRVRVLGAGQRGCGCADSPQRRSWWRFSSPWRSLPAHGRRPSTTAGRRRTPSPPTSTR